MSIRYILSAKNVLYRGAAGAKKMYLVSYLGVKIHLIDAAGAIFLTLAFLYPSFVPVTVP